MLRERGICNKEWVHEWDLSEKPRFTEQEVSTAKMLFAVGIEKVKRSDYSDGDLTACAPEDEGGGRWCWTIPHKLFPSILPGQSYTLKEIMEVNPG